MRLKPLPTRSLIHSNSDTELIINEEGGRNATALFIYTTAIDYAWSLCIIVCNFLVSKKRISDATPAMATKSMKKS